MKKGKGKGRGSSNEGFSPSYDLFPESVKEAYSRMPGEIASAAEAYAQASDAALRAKHQRDTKHAAVYLEIVEESERMMEKKPPEGVLKARIYNNVDYQDACTAYHDAELAKGNAQAVMEALRTKREMLISLGAHVRQELQLTGTVEPEEGGPGEEDDEE